MASKVNEMSNSLALLASQPLAMSLAQTVPRTGLADPGPWTTAKHFGIASKSLSPWHWAGARGS